jgi:hypothetical protein
LKNGLRRFRNPTHFSVSDSKNLSVTVLKKGKITHVARNPLDIICNKISTSPFCHMQQPTPHSIDFQASRVEWERVENENSPANTLINQMKVMEK